MRIGLLVSLTLAILCLFAASTAAAAEPDKARQSPEEDTSFFSMEWGGQSSSVKPPVQVESPVAVNASASSNRLEALTGLFQTRRLAVEGAFQFVQKYNDVPMGGGTVGIGYEVGKSCLLVTGCYALYTFSGEDSVRQSLRGAGLEYTYRVLSFREFGGVRAGVAAGVWDVYRHEVFSESGTVLDTHDKRNFGGILRVEAGFPFLRVFAKAVVFSGGDRLVAVNGVGICGVF